MARGRVVLKSICQSKKLAALPDDSHRLLYTWIISNLDYNGAYYADPAVVKGTVFTRLKHTENDIADMLNTLAAADLIRIYESGNDQFLYVPDFIDKHPKIDAREAKTSIPQPPIYAEKTELSTELSTGVNNQKPKTDEKEHKKDVKNTVNTDSVPTSENGYTETPGNLQENSVSNLIKSNLIKYNLIKVSGNNSPVDNLQKCPVFLDTDFFDYLEKSLSKTKGAVLTEKDKNDIARVIAGYCKNVSRKWFYNGCEKITHNACKKCIRTCVDRIAKEKDIKTIPGYLKKTLDHEVQAYGEDYFKAVQIQINRRGAANG